MIKGLVTEIRRRVYKLKGRLYVEGKYLKKAGFDIGTHIVYEVDNVNKTIIVRATNSDTKNRVASTTQKAGNVVPVIDIKKKDVKDFFEANENVEVSILNGKIIFNVLEEVKSEDVKKDNVLEFKEKKVAASYTLNIREYAKAVNSDESSITDIFRLKDVKSVSDAIYKTEIKTNKFIKMFSPFSGVGAFERALENTGIPFKIVNYSEINQYASKSYSLIHGVSEKLNLGDIRKIDPQSMPDFNLMTIGFPCKEISRAGFKRGFFDESGNVTRSGLVYFALNILNLKRPEYAVFENVADFLSEKYKEEFNSVMSILESSGYNSYFKVFNASDYGLPQSRRRVIIVSIRKDIDDGFEFPKGSSEPRKVLKDIVKLKDVPEKYYQDKKRYENFKETLSIGRDGVITLGQLSTKGSQGGKVYSIEGLFPTLCSGTKGWANGYIKIKDKIRQLMPSECAMLQGFRAEDADILESAGISDTQQYMAWGNSIPVKFLEYIFKKLFKDYIPLMDY